MPRKIGGGGEGKTGLAPEEQRAATAEILPAVALPEEERAETEVPGMSSAGQEIKEFGAEARALFAEDGKICFECPFALAYGRSDYGGKGSRYYHGEGEKKNQDSMFVGADKNEALVVGVIDGAGGSGYGELASKAVNGVLLREMADGASLDEAMIAADKETRAEVKREWREKGGDEDDPFRPDGYACAAIARVEPSGQVTIGWVGDSKIMTVRNGEKLEAGTSVLQNRAAYLLARGFGETQDYYTHRRKNIITCMLGSRAVDIADAMSKRGTRELSFFLGTREVDEQYGLPQIRQFQGQDGDQIILASDGLWDVVSEYEAAKLAEQHRGRPEELQRALFDLAYERNNSEEGYAIVHGEDERGEEIRVEMDSGFGRGDNITVQVIELKNLGN